MMMRRWLLWLGLLVAVSTLPAPLWAQAAVEADPAAALLAAAERRDREGDSAGALSDYELLVQQFPESAQAPEALLRIARGRLAAGDPSAARAAAERLVATYPGSPQAAAGLLLEGRMLADRPSGVEDLDNARRTLEKVWLLFPRMYYPELAARSAARVLDGQLALRLGRPEEASVSFVEVLEMEPESSWSAAAHIGLGSALVEAGEWQAAAESFQAALDVEAADDDGRALARRRLELLLRRFLRAATGTRPWRAARTVGVGGVELRRLSGVAASDAGRLLLVDAGGDLAILLAGDGSVERRWAARDGSRPSWDGPTPQVAADDAVQLPDSAARQFVEPGRGRALDGIRAVERGPFGSWIVLASRSDGVLAYPAERGEGRVLLAGDGDPVDLALDAAGNLYVLEKRSRRVVIVDLASGERAGSITGGWRQAAAVSVDPFGYVHVLDEGSRRVHTYDRAGAEVGAVGPVLPGGVELRRPEDLAAAGDGRLYIADSRTGLIVLE